MNWSPAAGTPSQPRSKSAAPGPPPSASWPSTSWTSPPTSAKPPNDLDVPDGDDPRSHLLSIAARESRRHRDYATALAPVDAIEREAAALGLGPDSPDLAAVHRAERSVTRRLTWFRSQFKTSRRDPRPPDPGDLPAWTPPRKREPDVPLDESAASSTLPESARPPNPGRASPDPRRRRA